MRKREADRLARRHHREMKSAAFVFAYENKLLLEHIGAEGTPVAQAEEVLDLLTCAGDNMFDPVFRFFALGEMFGVIVRMRGGGMDRERRTFDTMVRAGDRRLKHDLRRREAAQRLYARKTRKAAEAGAPVHLVALPGSAA